MVLYLVVRLAIGLFNLAMTPVDLAAEHPLPAAVLVGGAAAAQIWGGVPILGTLLDVGGLLLGLLWEILTWLAGLLWSLAVDLLTGLVDWVVTQLADAVADRLDPTN